MKNSEEIWKDIPGYEGKYQASNMGRIKSLGRYVRTARGQRYVKEKILKQHIRDVGGHLGVSLGKDAHNIGVHRAVAMAFLGLPENEDLYVLHCNGDPTDNRPENLRYGTQKENILDVYYQGKAWRKLTIDDVEAIRFGIYCGYSNQELATLYDVNPTTIKDIKNWRRYEWLK